MTFGNPVVGGTTLIRPAIQSPNYIAGSAGWKIAKDGTAEFSNIVIRGGTTTQGLFLMYNGTPAIGNLIGSIASLAGTDAYGNTYARGFNFGNQAGAHFGVDIFGNVYFVNTLGQNVIVIQPGKQAMLFYSGAPATGNLNVSIAAAAGTDNNANAFTQGIEVQNGGTVTAKHANGSTAVLSGNTPTSGLLANLPGLAMQPIGNTGDPAVIGALTPTDGTLQTVITSPSALSNGVAGRDYARMILAGAYGTATPAIALTADTLLLNGVQIDANGNINMLKASNRYHSSVVITPSASGVPTSAVITFPVPLTGTSFSCQVTPNSTVPGSAVIGWSYSALSSTGVTIWLNRTGALTATTLSFTVEGK